MSARNEISAGGVVCRKVGDSVEILVSKHSGYHKWVLPKGRVEEGERVEETALREVEEEAGVKAKIITSLGDPEEYVYTFNGEKVFKKVYYFLMEYVEGDTASHDFEMEDVQWVSFEKAIELMGYEGAKQVLERAQKTMESI